MGEYAAGIATRNKIYHVSKHLFYEKGVSGTSYNDICEAANVNRGLIPYYFKSKSNIAIEVTKEFVASMEQCVADRWGDEVITEVERNIMTELLMFRMLAADRNLCRFYCEIRTDPAFRETTYGIQENVMKAMAARSGASVGDGALPTIISMVEGTETELVRAVYDGRIRESIENMVSRDVSTLFHLMGVDFGVAKEWYERVVELARSVTMVCTPDFECSIEEIG